MQNRLDIVKNILFGVIRAVITYIWWTLMLFIASLLLLNIWRVEWTQILILAGILTVVTVVVYIAVKQVKKNKKNLY